MKRILAVALAFTLAQQTPADRLRQLAEDILAALGPPKVPIAVSPAVDLQAVIDAAKPGDVLALPPGAVYTGNFVLRTGLTLTTAGTLPAGRVAPTTDVARLVSPNAAPALFIPSGQDLSLIGLEFACNGGGECVSLGDGSSAQDSLAKVPGRILLDRVYVHGDPVNGQKRCVGLNSGETTIKDSYISDCKRMGQDSQAIGSWNGPGPFTITNSYLEGATENVMFGGTDPPIPSVVAEHIIIRGNTFTKPLNWRAERWQVKNLLEFKNARHVLVEGNIFEHCWPGFTQGGYAILLTPRNQDGGAPWVQVADITIQNNIIRQTAGGFSILGTDDTHPSLRTTGLHILNNQLSEIDPVVWNGPNGEIGTGRIVTILGGPSGVEIAHTTASGANLNSFLTIGGAAIEGFIMRDNVADEGFYGWKVDAASQGLAAVLLHSPGSVLTRNVMLNATTERWIDYGPTNARQADGTVPSPFAASDGGIVGVDASKLPK